jgi:hypothetical protein
MVRRKSQATIMVADGGGGMAKVQDRRFETGDWPIRSVVPKEQADPHRGLIGPSRFRSQTTASWGLPGPPELTVMVRRSDDAAIR